MPYVRDELARCFATTHTRGYLAKICARGPRENRATYVHDVTPEDVIRWVQTAELFWVSDSMTAVASQAAKTTPPYRLAHDDVPASVGLLIWQTPVSTITVTAVDGVDIHIALRGILWAPAETVFGYGIGVVVLVDTDVMLASPAYVNEALPLEMEDPGVMARMRSDLGPLSALDLMPMTFMELDQRVGNEAMASTLATWLIMGQRIAVSETQRLPFPMRQEYRKARKPEPTVRVITLRRARVEHVDDPDGQAPGRTYHHQWVVEGHWREPASHWKIQKPIWIFDYVKGPEGAPMLGGERVSVLRR